MRRRFLLRLASSAAVKDSSQEGGEVRVASVGVVKYGLAVLEGVVEGDCCADSGVVSSVRGFDSAVVLGGVALGALNCARVPADRCM